MWSCHTISKDDPLVCSGNGICQSQDRCQVVKPPGGFSIFCFGQEYSLSTVCNVHGDCISNDTCDCHIGYFGIECDKYCKDGETCSGNGHCKLDATCHCKSSQSEGYWTEMNCTTCQTGYSGSNCLHKDDATNNQQDLTGETTVESNMLLLLLLILVPVVPIVVAMVITVITVSVGLGLGYNPKTKANGLNSR